MAYSQYSTSRKPTNEVDDDQTGGGSSSFSSWNHLMNTAPRKRNLGRVKTTAMPQRMCMNNVSETPEKSYPMPQRLNNLPDKSTPEKSYPMPQRLNKATPERCPMPMPQRLNHVTEKSAPERSYPMPQRLNNFSEKSFPLAQRLNSPKNSPEKKTPMPQRTVSNYLKTPEMPQLKSLNFSPSTARRKQTRSPSAVRIRAKRSPSPKSRSRSTPPPIKSQRPQTNQVLPDRKNEPSREKLVVNGKSYEIMGKIGKGGSSEVFQVLPADGSDLLAIKRVDLSEVSDNEAEAFLKEVNLLQKLQGNDRIVKLIDYEERTYGNGSGRELLVVMEKGQRDLQNLLKALAASEEGLSEIDVKYYWEGMLKSVSVVHKAGIIHSDLKPANFLIVDGMIKLIDFGIASKIQDDKTHVTKENQMGTLNYISPEVLNSDVGYVKVGKKSDVWSMGCILYNLVYKKLPFAELKNPIQKMQAIINPEHKINFPRDKDSLRGHDPQVVDVLQRCLVRDVSKRASIEDLLDHSYLKSPGGPQIKETRKNLTAVDHLSSNFLESLTPRTFKRVVMENISNSNINSKNLTIPTYSQES